jgi:hypothetical protein
MAERFGERRRERVIIRCCCCMNKLSATMVANAGSSGKFVDWQHPVYLFLREWGPGVSASTRQSFLSLLLTVIGVG